MNPENPYSPPRAGVTPTQRAAALPPVRIGGWPTQFTMIALVLVALAAVTSALAEMRLWVMAQQAGDSDVSVAAWEKARLAAEYTGVALGLLYLLTAVPFVTWLHRARRNLDGMEVTGLRFRPAVAVWSWFVPVLNLWRPFQVTTDVWQASAPAARAPRTLPSPPWLVLAWWGLFLLPVVIRVGGVALLGGRVPWGELSGHYGVSTLEAAAYVPGAAITIELVRRLNQRQAALRDHLPPRRRLPSLDEPYRSS